MARAVDSRRIDAKGLMTALAPFQAEFSLSQLVTLLAVQANPGMSVNELAEFIGTTQQTASRNVAILLGRYQNSAMENSSVRTGAPYIIQGVNQLDPRKRTLHLSSAGTAIIEQVLRHLEDN